MSATRISHAQALELAGATPAFPPAAAEERELHSHLRACPECAALAARLASDLDAIGRVDPAVAPRLHDRIREVAMAAPRSGPSPIGIVAILALLATAVVGATIGAGALLRQTTTPTAGPLVEQPGDAIRWHTDVVDLAARSLSIEANGTVFSGVPSPRVASDPGSLSYWTLEVEWQEQARVQRLHLYFAADRASWWISEVRVYDGAAAGEADWARFPPGPYARTPIAAMYMGDLDLRGTSATGPVRLRIEGLRIAVRPAEHVTRPLGGGKVLLENGNPATNGDPFGAGGPLQCSGILQLPPVEAEARLLALGYALSWRWEYATGANTGFAEVRERAPATGWITGTGVGSSGELIVFVADPGRPFGGPPRDLPPECPAPAP